MNKPLFGLTHNNWIHQDSNLKAPKRKVEKREKQEPKARK